jgi:hypothetical protein
VPLLFAPGEAFQFDWSEDYVVIGGRSTKHMDVEICDQCGGTVKVIACIEDPAVIKKILDHLDKTAPTEQGSLPQSRAPP